MSEEWTWELSNRAADGLRALDDVVSDEFRNPPDFAKPLTSVKRWQSLRIGDYRAIVRFDRENQRIQEVWSVTGHRSTTNFRKDEAERLSDRTVTSVIHCESGEQLLEGIVATASHCTPDRTTAVRSVCK